MNYIEIGKENVDLDIGEYGHHGDVIYERVEFLPKDWGTWPVVNDSCLAYGEVTGHSHKIFGDVEIRENPETKDRYFVQKDGVIVLKHQEHNPRAFIGEGRIYKTFIAQEYDHFDELIRSVQD